MNKNILLIILIVIIISSIIIFHKYNRTRLSYPEIIGDETCIKATNEALSYINENSPNDYKIVLKNIGKIECKRENSGVFVWERPPRFTAGYDTYMAGKTWYSGAILHDSCHVIQYRNKRNFNGEEAEKECLKFQEQAMIRIGAQKREIDMVRASLETRYWETPYTERNW